MFDIGYFGRGLTGLVAAAIELYFWVVCARAVVSWLSPDPRNPIVQFLSGVTDPVLDRLRSVLPRFLWSTGLDFTPLVLLLLLRVVLLGLRGVRFG